MSRLAWVSELKKVNSETKRDPAVGLQQELERE